MREAHFEHDRAYTATRLSAVIISGFPLFVYVAELKRGGERRRCRAPRLFPRPSAGDIRKTDEENKSKVYFSWLLWGLVHTIIHH